MSDRDIRQLLDLRQQYIVPLLAALGLIVIVTIFAPSMAVIKLIVPLVMVACVILVTVGRWHVRFRDRGKSDHTSSYYAIVYSIYAVVILTFPLYNWDGPRIIYIVAMPVAVCFMVFYPLRSLRSAKTAPIAES